VPKLEIAFRQLRAAFRCGPEYFLGACQQLRLPLRGLVRVHVAALSHLGQRLFPLQGHERDFRLGLRSLISTPSSHGLLLLSLAKSWPFNLELSTYSRILTTVTNSI
jgi:hypothetical protein